MKKIEYITIFLLLLGGIYCSKSIPIITYEKIKNEKVIEGKCDKVFMDGGNKTLSIGSKYIRKLKKEFNFENNIKALLVKNNYLSGDCISFGSRNFDQITKYPIKLQINRDTIDSIEILEVKNNGFEYKYKNEIYEIRRNDSLCFSKTSIDTVVPRNSKEMKRVIIKREYRTIIYYKDILNLKTLKYEKENN